MMTNEELKALVPEEWIIGLGKVLEMGAVKHGKDSWKNKNNNSLKLVNNTSSIQRHWIKRCNGDRYDDESGLAHQLHVACRSLMDYSREYH